MKVNGFEDTIEWYDKNAKNYAEVAEKVPLMELIEKFTLMLPDSPKVLDAGCGSGRDSRIIQSKGAKVTGIDISQGLLNEAKIRSEGIEFVKDSITTMPFRDASFNGVWAHASLVHLETLNDVKRALAEFNRVLMPSGALHIFVKEQKGDEKTAIVSDSVSNHDRFFRYYTEVELKELVEEVGFRDIEITHIEDPHKRSEVSWIALFAKKQN